MQQHAAFFHVIGRAILQVVSIGAECLLGMYCRKPSVFFLLCVTILSDSNCSAGLFVMLAVFAAFGLFLLNMRNLYRMK